MQRSNSLVSFTVEVAVYVSPECSCASAGCHYHVCCTEAGPLRTTCFTCVKIFWRTKHNTIGTFVIQWDVNKWPLMARVPKPRSLVFFSLTRWLCKQLAFSSINKRITSYPIDKNRTWKQFSKTLISFAQDHFCYLDLHSFSFEDSNWKKENITSITAYHPQSSTREVGVFLLMRSRWLIFCRAPLLTRQDLLWLK